MNSTLFMQTEIMHAFMKRHKMSVEKFQALDKKHNILEFIEKGYEPFHLMGNKGILKEVEDFVGLKLAKIRRF